MCRLLMVYTLYHNRIENSFLRLFLCSRHHICSIRLEKLIQRWILRQSRCPLLCPEWGSPSFRSFLIMLRASFRHDLMTTSILPALIYSHKAMLLAWEFFSVGSTRKKFWKTYMSYLWARSSHQKKLTVRFLSKFWPPLYDTWGR